MSDQHPVIDDPALGRLVRATTDLEDGDTLTHDWYAGTIETDADDLELMIEGTAPSQIEPLLPRVRDVVARIGALQRVASDAVVTTFSTGEPEPHELDEAAEDLTLETIEAAADGTIVLHLLDTCGSHFPEGYWPAVHLGEGDTIEQVTVES